MPYFVISVTRCNKLLSHFVIFTEATGFQDLGPENENPKSKNQNPEAKTKDMESRILKMDISNKKDFFHMEMLITI